MILADIINNPNLVTSLKRGVKLTLKCSFSLCNNEVIMCQQYLNYAIKRGNQTTFCSKACRYNHRRIKNIVIKDGEEGRICTDCKLWFPKNKMANRGNSLACVTCESNKPNNKFTKLKYRAKSEGFEWNLTYKDFMLFWGKPCTYCNSEIKTIGLDKIIPNLGYTLDNVVSCCHPCNRGKTDGTVKEFLDRCETIAKKHAHKVNNQDELNATHDIIV